MHLIVAAARLPQGLAVDALDVPALRGWLRTASIVGHHTLDNDAGAMPHERCWARDMKLDTIDAPLPYARALAAFDGVPLDDAAWGLVSPVHWRVAMDHVALVPPGELMIDALTSRALVDTLAPWFEGAGYSLRYGTPHRWYASHPGFANTTAASPERVAGLAVEHWAATGPHARAWQQLQNECQMLLHEHAVNDERQDRGLAPINSLWLSGTGPAVTVPDTLRVDHRLADAGHLTNDLHSAWRSLDHEVIAPLLADTNALQITLCGARSSVSLAQSPRAWWHALRPRAPLALASLLNDAGRTLP